MQIQDQVVTDRLAAVPAVARPLWLDDGRVWLIADGTVDLFAVALELGEEVAEIVVFHACMFRRPGPILANPTRRHARLPLLAQHALPRAQYALFVRDKVQIG
jgi:hypothetical protein